MHDAVACAVCCFGFRAEWTFCCALSTFIWHHCAQPTSASINPHQPPPLQSCQDLLGYYAAVCPTSDLRLQFPISRVPLRRMQAAADALRQHGHPLVRKLAPYHRPLVRVEALKLVLMDEVPELVRGDEETRHLANLLWLELEVDTIARHFSRLQAALEDLLGHVPGDKVVVLDADEIQAGAKKVKVDDVEDNGHGVEMVDDHVVAKEKQVLDD